MKLNKTILNLTSVGISLMTIVSCTKDSESIDVLETTQITKLSSSSLQLSYDSITASEEKTGYPIDNVEDGSRSTRWAGYGSSANIYIDFGTEKTIDYMKIAFPSGNSRKYKFDYWVGDDGKNWNKVSVNTSSGTTTNLETFDFTDTTTRYARLKMRGSDVNLWNYISELEIYGKESSSNGSSDDSSSSSNVCLLYTSPSPRDS